MHRVLVLLFMCAYACASSAVVRPPPPPPPYSESLVATQKSFGDLLKYLDSPIANRVQRNFAIFGLPINIVALSVANGNDFEYSYSLVDIVVKLAALVPDAARRVVLKDVSKVLEIEKPMTKLIEELCYPGSPVGTIGRRCDELVDSVVKKHPWYQPYATLLLDSGRFGVIYKEIQADIETAVRENKVQEFLIRNKYALKPLIYQISKLLNLDEKFGNSVVVSYVT